MWNADWMHHGAGPWDGGFWPWPMIVQGLVWLLLVVAGVFLILHILRVPWGRSEGRSGLDQLREAYARGEVERDEFLRRKKDLD